MRGRVSWNKGITHVADLDDTILLRNDGASRLNKRNMLKSLLERWRTTLGKLGPERWKWYRLNHLHGIGAREWLLNLHLLLLKVELSSARVQWRQRVQGLGSITPAMTVLATVVRSILLRLL